MVFVIQSMVADGNRRDLLHQLNLAYSTLHKENPKSGALQLVQQVQSNLARLWSEV